MPLLTTTIGAYPKPDYIPIPDWFRQENTVAHDPTKALDDCRDCEGEEAEALIDRGVREVVEEQTSLGIDVLTDGEVRRENYIHYHCRRLGGIRFDRLTPKSMRSGEWRVSVPTITGRVEAGDPFLSVDWRKAQSFTANTVKMTVPGPMTIMDSTYDDYYGDEKKLARDLADALNVEIRRLADSGCRFIQVDEPVFARKPDQALAYGVANLARCFFGVPPGVTRAVHICCGYPDRLDSRDYQKAPPESYFQLAPALDQVEIDAVSLEDAHRPNDLSLFDLFEQTTVILGVVGIARSRIETTEEIESRLRQVAAHVPADRLMAAPDCGLGLLPRELIRQKLGNMVRAARNI